MICSNNTAHGHCLLSLCLSFRKIQIAGYKLSHSTKLILVQIVLGNYRLFQRGLTARKGGQAHKLFLRIGACVNDLCRGLSIADDLKGILRDIRSEHRPDTMTADESSLVTTVQGQLQDAMNFEGSSEEKKAKALLATLGIDYDAITMEQFVNLIEVLKLSKHLKTPISQRGKTTMTHGKGKRKKH